MYWSLDPHTAAYGRFQLAFTALDTTVSDSLVALQRPSDPQRAFAETKRRLRLFGYRLTELIAKVEQCGENEVTRAVLDACATARQISKWRNSRVHAKVRFVRDELVLVGDDEMPVQITDRLCDEQASRAIEALVQIKARMPFLVSCLNVHDMIDSEPTLS